MRRCATIVSVALIACTAGNPDYEPPGDFSSVAERGAWPDLAVADLSRSGDGSRVHDLAADAADLAPALDSAVAVDFVVAIDLALPDLAIAPDLACGCPVANGVGMCIAGGCAIASCNYGFADCNGVEGDGCEVDARTDPDNCGSCGHPCSSSHVTPVCMQIPGATICNGPCDPGWGDCNGQKRIDGCEDHIAVDPLNCGGCGLVCSTNHVTASCSGSVCNGTCVTGFADCNGNKQIDGCEIYLLNDRINCGACGNVCPLPGCSNGACK